MNRKYDPTSRYDQMLPPPMPAEVPEPPYRGPFPFIAGMVVGIALGSVVLLILSRISL